jgi:hypothetical protein
MLDAGAEPAASKLGLLLTAAVVPHEALATFDRRPERRAAGYQSGIAAWSFFREIGPVVVGEASGLSELEFRQLTGLEAGANPFEFIPSVTGPEAAKRGKGAAELDLVAHALRQSVNLADATRIVKVTGRYVVRNAESLIGSVAGEGRVPEIAVNLHNHFSYADSRVFVFSRRFFEDYLYPLRARVDDTHGVWLEHILADATLRAAADGLDWGMLPIAPRLTGVAGTTGASIGDSTAAHTIRRVKHALKVRALGARRGRR